MRKTEGIYADFKEKEAKLEEQIKAREDEVRRGEDKERKRGRNHEGKTDFTRRFGKGREYKRAPSVSSLRGVDDGSEKYNSYNKRRKNE